MRDLSVIAEQLRQKGREGDTILAHINPVEAQLLGGKKKHINPHTGLPEFRGGGFWHSFAKTFLGKPGHAATRKMKEEGTYRKPRLGNWLLAAAPLVAGPLSSGLGGMLPSFMSKFGTMLPSGLGGGLAGLIGNSLQGKRSILKQSPGQAFIGGAGKGIASSAITNELANAFNLDPYSGFGKHIGMREPFFSGLRSNLAPNPDTDFMGPYKPEGGMGGGGMDFTKLTSLLGNMGPGAGRGAPQMGPEEDESFPGEPSYSTSGGMMQPGPQRDAMAHLQPGSRLPSQGMGGDAAEHESPFAHSQLLEMLMKMLREHPERREEILQEINKVHGGAKHLKAGGYVHGKSGGQTDDVPTKLAEGSYVMNATDVSLLGDGNSNHGATKLKEFETHIKHHSPFVRGERGNWESTKKINALVSDGEYIIRKDVVDRLGKGDNKKGAQILDNMRKKLRTHKGVKTILPPKSKPLTAYIGRI